MLSVNVKLAYAVSKSLRWSPSSFPAKSLDTCSKVGRDLQLNQQLLQILKDLVFPFKSLLGQLQVLSLREHFGAC